MDYVYTAQIGEGSGRVSEVLEAGRQKIRTDALGYLIALGVPIPETGNRIGTLRVEVPLGSEVEAVVRTTTKVPDGRAGLAYLGVTEEEGFEEPVYLCGLRQNRQDRSNLAVQNMGAPEAGAITLRTTVYSERRRMRRPGCCERWSSSREDSISIRRCWALWPMATSRWSGWRGPLPSTPTR